MDNLSMDNLSMSDSHEETESSKDSTNYHEGKHIKKLECLNRDLSKVLTVLNNIIRTYMVTGWLDMVWTLPCSDKIN